MTRNIASYFKTNKKM